MSVIASALRHMLASGMDRDAILTAVAEMEAALRRDPVADRKRERDRQRMQDRRAESRDVALPRATEATSADLSRTRVVTPFSSSLRSEEVGGGGGECERAHESVSDDWPPGKAQDHAKLIVEAVASPWLDPMKSPDLVTTAGRLAAWRRDGASWEHDVLPVVSGICAGRRSRVSTWKFFNDAVGRSMADNRAALTIPEARARGSPSLTDQIAAEKAEARRRVLEG